MASARKELWIFIGIGLGLGVACSLSSFTRSLDYPLALALTVPASLAGLLTPILSRVVPGGLFRQWSWYLAGPVLLVAAALVAPLLSSASCPCDPFTGVQFVILGPLVSGVLATGAGLLVRELTRRRRRAVAAALGLLVLNLALPLGEFLLGPSVRFYGMFFGMYHGAIYDELVYPELVWVICRLWELLLVSSLLLGLEIRRKDLPSHLLAVPASGLLLALLLLIPGLNPGFILTEGMLDAAMPEAASCPHFSVHARKGGAGQALAEAACRDLEFRLSQQQALLNLEPDRRFTLYLYDSPEHKRNLIGAGQTSIARPWQGQIHIPIRGVGTGLLAHELAHVLLGQAANSPLAIPMSRGIFPKTALLEGAAVALEPPRGLADLHHWTAALRREGLSADPLALMNPAGFWTMSSGRAYTVAGSFIRWLLETRGPGALLAAYGGRDPAEAWREDPRQLVAAWEAWLDSLEVDDDLRALARFIYDRPSVFQKQCPYGVARSLALGTRLLRDQGCDQALPPLRRALAMDPARQDTLARLARTLAGTGDVDNATLMVETWLSLADRSPGEQALVRRLKLEAGIMGGNLEESMLSDLRRGPTGRIWERDLALLEWLSRRSRVEAEVGTRMLLGLMSREELKTLLKGEEFSPAGLECFFQLMRLTAPWKYRAPKEWTDQCLEDPLSGGLKPYLLEEALRAAWLLGDLEEAEKKLNQLEQLCQSGPCSLSRETLDDWKARLTFEANPGN